MTASLPTHRDSSGHLRASVVIPTYNRCASLERVLRALAMQTTPQGAFETLVIADGCTDETVALCQRLMHETPYTLRLIEQENAGPAAARNRGVREARAALIVFVDDDVAPDAEWLAVHLEAHAPDASDDVVAIGPLLPPTDVRLNAWGAWEERALCSHYEDMTLGRWKPSYRQFYTGNASLARRLIVDAGGFDARFRRAEDIELGLRMSLRGCSFVFLPEARGWHYVQRTFASWQRMPTAYGAATVTMAREHTVDEVALAAEEFHFRNALVRRRARICVGSRRRVGVMTALLRPLAATGWALHVPVVTNACCSVVFNLRYYQGFATELGGADRFWRLVREAAPVTQEQRGMMMARVRVLAMRLLEMPELAHEPEDGLRENERLELGASR